MCSDMLNLAANLGRKSYDIVYKPKAIKEHVELYKHLGYYNFFKINARSQLKALLA